MLKEPSEKEILNAVDFLDDADVPTEDRLLRVICPNCGLFIEVGEVDE